MISLMMSELLVAEAFFWALASPETVSHNAAARASLVLFILIV
jgi:hypothetical protein